MVIMLVKLMMRQRSVINKLGFSGQNFTHLEEMPVKFSIQRVD